MDGPSPRRVPFRERFSAEQRAAECVRASRREGYVPTIIEPHGASAPPLDKEKYLLPADLTCAQLIYVVRKRLRMLPSEALFLFCHSTMIHGAMPIRDLHFRFACQEDGFLYVCYSLENAFGRGRVGSGLDTFHHGEARGGDEEADAGERRHDPPHLVRVVGDHAGSRLARAGARLARAGAGEGRERADVREECQHGANGRGGRGRVVVHTTVRE